MLAKIVFFIVKFLFPRLKVFIDYPIDEPAVFVCNHLGSFGPLAMTLYFKYPMRPWSNYRSMTKGLAAKEISENLFDREAKVPPFIKKMMGKILEIPALWVMGVMKSIPVYDTANMVGETLNESIRALKSGNHIVVFANEDQQDHISEGLKYGIKTGCIYLAHIYERNTKKKLKFYPVHISRRKKEIRIGKPVIYERANGTRTEVKRVSGYLAEKMRELGAIKKTKKSRYA